MKYTDEQLRALQKYYPISDYNSLNVFFPGLSKRQIMQIAHNHGIKSENPGHRIDLTGRVFGKLTVLGIDHITNENRIYWKCKCSCGNECISVGHLLTSGQKQSCGCTKEELISIKNSKDHTGEKFGMLTAMERLPHYQGKDRTYYRCLCECGNETIVSGSNLIRGHVKTCGCISRNRKSFSEAFKTTYSDQVHKYAIYKHTVPNGKVYIGVTRQDTTRRWQNGNGYSTQQKFWRAIQKYGWDNIEHSILEMDLSEKEALEKEIQYINKYNSTDSRFGYNISKGGTTGRSLVSPVMQYYQGEPVNFFESRTHAAKALSVSVNTVLNYIRGKSLIDSYRFDELPRIHTYDIDPALYDIRSEQHLNIKHLMQEQLKAKTISRNRNNSKPVCKYDMQGHFICTYPSIADATRDTGDSGNIVSALKGIKSKSASGYQWRYDEGDHSDISPFFAKGKSVIQIDPYTHNIIAEYPSIADAERITKVKRNLIWKACNGQHITSGGFIWRYKDDLSEDDLANIDKIITKQKNDRIASYKHANTKKVCQYDMQGHFIRTYSSITEAIEIIGTKTIYQAVSPKNRFAKSAAGYQWRYDVGDHSDILPLHVNGKPVVQIDPVTNNIIAEFQSIRDAHRSTGIWASQIHKVCNGQRKTAGGYVWKYKD